MFHQMFLSQSVCPLMKDYLYTCFGFTFVYMDLYFGFVIRAVLDVVSQFLFPPDEGLMCTAAGMEALDNR